MTSNMKSSNRKKMTIKVPSSRKPKKSSFGKINLKTLFCVFLTMSITIPVLMNFFHIHLLTFIYGDHLDLSARNNFNLYNQRPFGLRKPSFQLKHDYRDLNMNKSSKLANLICRNNQVNGSSHQKYHEEMIYWSDIPFDSEYKSPFYDPNKYLTFEPDHGGWNNIRMAMETVLAMAHAMGRTLVLPPEKKMYLLTKNSWTQKTDFSFNDFFDLNALSREHDGLKIITMEEFLSRNDIPGIDANKKKILNNQVNWNGQNLQPLWDYLRDIGEVRIWDPRDCMVAFPSSTDSKSVESLEQMITKIKEGVANGQPIPLPKDYDAKPVPVNSPTEHRFKENMSERLSLCIYDHELQKVPLIHFKDSPKEKVRLLTHFYSFLFFQDWRQDLWTKRFIRDHVRYHDEIICIAGDIVNAIREIARSKDPDVNPDGLYDSFHIRRGDFQYKKTRLDASAIYDKSKNKLKEGSTIYIATDERDRSFFQPLADHYDLLFLEDFKEYYVGLNTNYYGMLDQLICSKSNVFFGTWFSTFSGYINRLRGYYITKHKLEGYKDGTMKSWYLTPEDRRDEMQIYKPSRKPFYIREFPVSWRDIDIGIDV